MRESWQPWVLASNGLNLLYTTYTLSLILHNSLIEAILLACSLQILNVLDIILETEINFQNAVTFVLVKLDTKYKGKILRNNVPYVPYYFT